MSTYAERQAYRDAHPGAIVDNNSSSDGGFHSDTPNGVPSSGPTDQSSGGQPSAPGAPQQTYPGVSKSDLSAITAGFAASSGLSIKQLEEQAREFDANLDWQKKMWEQQGLPQLAIQQRAQDLAEKQFATQTDLANRQQGFTEEMGRRQAALAEKTQADANAIAQGQLGVAQGQLGLGQSQLGLDTLKTAASLTGPSDWIKAANFSRGVGQSNLPAFVTKLMTGDTTSVLGGPAPGATQSAPVTMGSLAAGMGAGNQYGLTPGQRLSVGGAATSGNNMGPGDLMQYEEMGRPGPGGYSTANPPIAAQPMLTSGVAGTAGTGADTSNVDYAAQQLRNVFAQGGQALGPQQIEGLTPTELAMFQGGGSDVGADVQGFMSQYQRSRIGQQAGTPGMTM